MATHTPQPGPSQRRETATSSRSRAACRSYAPSARAPRGRRSARWPRPAELTRAGARRILLTLQTLGYVDTDGKLFRLTPRILDLGFAYLSSMPIWNRAEPVMEALAQEVQESCSAAVLDATDIVYVLRVLHAQDHAHQPRRRLAPAGLLHFDGPTAAGRLGGRGSSRAPRGIANRSIHQAHPDRHRRAILGRSCRRAASNGAWSTRNSRKA